jgi:L-threonylcarbamoyladenylate synthase
MSDEETIVRAAQVLRTGGLVALPTETVYGLGADASNAVAIAKVFAVKGRPTSHPLIVHVADAAHLERWASGITPLARKLAQAVWPGPLTLVLPRAEGVLDAVTGGQPTVAVRVPAHPLTLAILRRFGGGVAAPSANRFGKVSPTTAAHVRADLGDDVDLVVDGGPCRVGLESTIVDLSRGDDAATILRPGGLGPEALAAIVGRPLPSFATSEVRVPGQLAAHYAPRARVLAVPAGAVEQTVASVDDACVGVIALGATGGDPQWTATGRGWCVVVDPDDALARHLYAVLRELDDRGCSVIVATLPAAERLGLAIADRLARAAASSRA